MHLDAINLTDVITSQNNSHFRSRSEMFRVAQHDGMPHTLRHRRPVFSDFARRNLGSTDVGELPKAEGSRDVADRGG